MDSFVLIPSGSANLTSTDVRSPKSRKNQVLNFIEEFRVSKTIRCSDKQYAEMFYSKTKYIQMGMEK